VDGPLRLRPGPRPAWSSAGFWIRVVAYIIDWVILAIASAVLQAISPALSIVTILYFPLCWGFLGQSIGMMPFGIRIVRNADGGKLTWGNVILRFIGMIIAFACILIGVIWVAFDSRKRGWADMIGGTVVIKERLVGYPAPRPRAGRAEPRYSQTAREATPGPFRLHRAVSRPSPRVLRTARVSRASRVPRLASRACRSSAPPHRHNGLDSTACPI